MIRDYIYSLMTDRRNGAAADAAKSLLFVFSLIYGFGVFARTLFYKFGIFKRERVPIKVISVGNLTLGGTGKTPFVIRLSEILKDELKHEVCVLIRGYGWDEQAMLKNKAPNIPVLVGEDRARSARRAVRLYGSDTAVLDDGFQHWELGRNLDIVLIDSRNPFGNGCLFPRGTLREPIEAISRADIVVFTKVNKERADLGKLREELKSLNKDIAFLETAHVPRCLHNAKTNKTLELSAITGKRVVLVSSIGDPDYFEDTVRGLNADIAEHIIFADHHNYSEADVAAIMKRCDEKAFDFIITTEKDAVKFNRMHFSFANYDLLTLVVGLEIVSGEGVLIDRLRSLYNS